MIKKTIRLKFINFCSYQFQFRPDATLIIILNKTERELFKLYVVTCSKNIKFSVRTSFLGCKITWIRANYSIAISFAVKWLALLLRIRGVPGSNLGPENGYRDWGLLWYSSVPQTNTRTVPQFRTLLFSSTLSHVHHSVTILPFDTK